MMKRILNLLALVFLFFFSDAQTIRTNNMPNFQQFGSSVTQTRINGILYPVVGYAPAIYTDTTDANLNLYLKSIPFVQISTTSDGKNWYRNLNVTKWEEMGSGSAGWGTTGNLNTFPGINYMGTNDDVGLFFRVNGKKAGYISSVADAIVVPAGDVHLGQYAGESSDTTVLGNTLVGNGAGRFIGQDFGVTGLGISTGNTFLGNWAGYFTQHPDIYGYGRNVFIGASSGFNNIRGGSNFGGGTFTLELNNAGSGNTATGRDALRSNIDGFNNTANGTLSLLYNSTGIGSINITNGGSGYTTATVTISPPYAVNPTGACGGTATAVATINAGMITAITVTDPGCGYSFYGGTKYTGYSHPPVTVTITGDGVGATATANVISGENNTATGISSGLYARLGYGNSYFGNSAGASARYKDSLMTFLGTNTDVSSGLSILTNISKSTAIGYNAKVRKSKNIILGATGSDQPIVVIGRDSSYTLNYTGSHLLDVNGNIKINGIVQEEAGVGYGNYIVMSQNYKGFPNITFGVGYGSSNPLNSGAFGISSLSETVIIGTQNNTGPRKLTIQNYQGARAIMFQQVRELARFADTTGNLLINTDVDAKDNYFLQVAGKTLLKDTVTISGQINAINIPASGTSTDSALAINRSTGYLEMRPVSGSGGFGDGIVSLGNSPYGLTKPNDSTYTADTTQLATILQTQHRIDSLAALKLAITDTTGQWIGSGWLASLVKYVDTTTVIATRTWVQAQGYVTTRDRLGFSGEDVTASANRTFNLNNYKFDLDSGSFHIKRKVTGQRSDDIFSVGIGATKSFYVNEVGNVYATELFAGSGSFSAIGGLVSLNSSTVRLNGSTTFNSFQKKFEFIKEWPAIDSIGFEIKNDTSGISTLPATWADTYKMLSLKYRSGVDNSLTERFDFRGNGDMNITGTGALKINVGNTAQRPSSAVAGQIRFNSDSIGTGSALEVYNGTDWVHLGSSGGGGSDGYVDNATFNTTTNYLTIEQTGAADVSVRIPPSYILNTIHPDSTGFILNDSTFRLKAITVTTNNNRLTTTTTRTDSTLNFLVDIKRDTVTLASFGGGGGQAGDTTAFSTSTIYGSFYNDGTDTLVITSMRGVLQGTSPSVTYDVYYNDSLNVTAGASKLVTAGTALTNTATGAAVTSFDNTKIPPGVWVWVKTTTVTTKPTYFSLSLIGYKSRI